jgi:tetratricopeptide (TPR) repeat protein
MPSFESLIGESRALVKGNRPLEALELISLWAGKHPQEPELQAELGKLLCLVQREDEAVSCLERSWGTPAARELADVLVRYFHARQLMAQKLGAADEAGKSLQSRVFAVVPENCRTTDLPGIALSAVLITKNEEKHLDRCLDSLKGRVDEIVVVDTGSTDRTVEIARKHGAKVEFFDWVDDFSAARNASLSAATGNWALWIDADEEVDPASWSIIREAVIRPHFGGYFMRIVNFTDEEGRSTYTHAPVRLFQLDPRIRFTGKIHEQITPSIDEIGLPLAHLERTTIYHYGYRPSEMAEKNKLNRTLSMLKKQIEEEPNEAFHWFNLANTYDVAKDHQQTIVAARKALELMDPGNNYGSLTYQLLASAYNAMGKHEEALGACGEAHVRGYFTILNQFEMAHAYLGMRRYEDALSAIEACLHMEWPETMTGDRGIKTHKALVMKGQILSEMDELEEAIECIDRALEVDPNFGLAHFAKGITLQRMGRLPEALEWLKRGFDDHGFGPNCLKAAGRVATAMGENHSAMEFFARAWKCRPADANAWSSWVQLLEKFGSPEECARAYAEFTLHHAANADVLINWGRSLEQMGDLPGALQKYQDAATLDPGNANVYFNAGDALYRFGQFLEAAECYQMALQSRPEFADGWFVLGNALAQLGVNEGAETAYRQALSLDQSHQGARHNLELISAA